MGKFQRFLKAARCRTIRRHRHDGRAVDVRENASAARFSPDQNWNACNLPAQSTARITSDALVPPKPKELDKATLMSRLRG